MIRSVPLDRLMVESDAPWCEVRPSHAGHRHVQTIIKGVVKERYDASADQIVKGRNEPFSCR